MRFERIRYNGEKVELVWHTREEDGSVTRHELTSREKPLGPFRAALAAFAPLVLALMEWPVGYEENLHITGLSINTEDAKKGGNRGIVVSWRKDLAESSAPAFGNTPHVREAQPEAPSYGRWQRWALAIEEAETQATLYQKGEREQAELELDGDSSETDEEADEEALAGVEE